MLRKLATRILALALCASTMTAPPQAVRAAAPEPTPIIVVDPEEPTLPIEPGKSGEPEKPEGQLECTSEFPAPPDNEITD